MDAQPSEIAVFSTLPFGELLKTLRKRQGLRQQTLAEKLGLHRNTLGLWERGEGLPDNRTLVLELARLLRLDEQETRILLEASLTAIMPRWQVPYQRNPFFTGRATFLSMLHACLGAQRVGTGCQSWALSGLGGIGKTQLALEYAYQHMFDYRAVFWVAAETVDTIAASFTAIAEQLRLPEYTEKDHHAIARAVQRWLATHQEWLLIFDNVEAVALIKPFLPVTHHGAILLTTRLRSLEGLAPTIELPPLSLEEGRLFLLRRIGLLGQNGSPEQPTPNLESSAGALVEAMGGLPLALDQAGAYIEKTGCHLSSYLQIYQSHQLQLLNERSEAAEHPLSVVKTILFSFQKLAQMNPAAADLLRICAFLAPEAIPESLFLREPSAVDLSSSVMTTDAHQFNLILGETLQYSLLHRQVQQATLSLHRLVQIVLRATMDEATACRWARCTAAIVGTCVSTVREDEFEAHDGCYLPHARAVLQHIEPWSTWEEPALLAVLYYYIGQVAEQYSQLTEARDVYLRGLASVRDLHHPLEAALSAHVGFVLSDIGDDQRGLIYLERGAELARQQQDYSTLCFALLHQGQIQDNLGNQHRAETLYQEGTELALRVKNWNMASAFLQDLGIQALRRGEYTRAAELYREGLTYVQQSNQVNRQSALLLTLGMAEIQQKQYEQALAYSLESLRLAQQVRQRYLICAATQNLGIIYRLLGQMEQAHSYLEESLNLAREMQHSWMQAEAQGEIGWLYFDQEQWEAAQKIFNEMLSTAQMLQAPQLLGDSLFGLARVAARQNHLEQARTLALESLAYFRQADDVRREQVAQLLATLPNV